MSSEVKKQMNEFRKAHFYVGFDNSNYQNISQLLEVPIIWMITQQKKI